MRTTILGDAGFGCEISGVDCGSASAPEIDRILELLFDHRVLVIRRQQLTARSYLDLMRAIGVPVLHVLQNLTVDGTPEILKICDYVDPRGVPFGVLDGGAYWHSDMSYLPELGVATSLYAVRAAPRSGGTSFLDLLRGWELVHRDGELLRLLGCRDRDDATRTRLDHRFGNRHASRDSSAADQRLSDEQRRNLVDVRHRLVERHPVTGTEALFATSGTATRVVGLDDRPSVEALDRLEEFLLSRLRPYTHRYQPGDLVIWDNMNTLHRGVGVSPTDDFEQSRLLYRINVRYVKETP